MADMTERLAAVKAYCRIDYDEDDSQLTTLLEMSDSYLGQCGVYREGHEAMYDVLVNAMVLNMFEGRCADGASALQTVPPITRQMLNQLKLVCAYGGTDDGDTGS